MLVFKGGEEMPSMFLGHLGHFEGGGGVSQYVSCMLEVLMMIAVTIVVVTATVAMGRKIKEEKEDRKKKNEYV